MEGSTRDSLVEYEQVISQENLMKMPQLAKNEAHVWIWNLNVERAVLSSMESLLPDSDWIRVRGLRSGEDARRYIVRRCVVRSILSRYLDLSPQEISFIYSDYGKPSLEQGLKIQLEFSVSDTFDLAALAVSAGHALGIDIERLRPFPKGVPPAVAFMSRKERKRISLSGENGRNRLLFQSWTRLEAVAKAEGVGIHSHGGGHIQPGPNLSRVQQSQRDSASCHHALRLTDLAMPAEYVGALAAPEVVDKVVVLPEM